ncbi:sodium:solute symporter family protein [Geomicrobium sediminis]|uniref:SSS family solute:Na+ symporter n=1 Tax=Geomicrobium sediminis TaxID=1347788 RepID=A0ABS2P6N4_9BACL|nr:hypothetical protein [Geomicrobium sediminis]MBM7631058.1 SSS family solute:Na+ symporter [Geomicrobium sediminis]
MSFNLLFLFMLLTFGLILVVASLVTRKWIRSSNDYLIAGREVGMIVNIFGVAAIGFAGTMISLGPGITILYGVWGSLGFSIAFMIIGLMLYGLFFTPYIRRSGAQTLPEWLEMRFDAKTRLLITISSIFGLLGIMANNVISMAIITTEFTGWSLLLTLAGIFFVFLFFTYIGGFWAITLTDFIQMIIGLIAMPVLLIAIISQYGGISFINSNWPSATSFFTAGIGGQTIPVFSLQYPSILTFVVMFGCFLVWGNNYYWLRASTARDEKTAKMSYVYAALLLALVPSLILLVVGVYTGAAFSDLLPPYGDSDPMGAYGLMLTSLPIGIAAIALLGALAASVSTATTALIGASSTAVRDIYQRYIRPEATSKQLIKPSKIITLVLGLLVWLLTFYPGGPLYLFAFSTAWLGPPSILVVLGIFWKRTTMKGAFIGGLSGIIATTLATLLGDIAGIIPISEYTHIGIIGLVVTLSITVFVSLATQPNYYGKASWNLQSQNLDVSVKKGSHEEQILSLINRGYNTMVQITDMLGVDSSVSNRAIENLDRQGLIVRKKLTGAGFYSFSLTDDGTRYSQGLVTFIEDKLTNEEIMFIEKIDAGIEVFNQYIDEENLESLKISAMFSKLKDDKYLIEKGLWRRQILVTDKGKGIVNKYKNQIIKEA